MPSDRFKPPQVKTSNSRRRQLSHKSFEEDHDESEEENKGKVKELPENYSCIFDFDLHNFPRTTWKLVIYRFYYNENYEEI